MPLPAPPPPPPPGPPPLSGLANFMSSSNVKAPPPQQQTPPDRSNLLNEIRKAGGLGGKIQLKKVVTNDRSAPSIGGSANGAKSSSPLSNGSGARTTAGQSSTVSRALGSQMMNKMSFQEQLNSAIKANKLSSSHSSGSIHNAVSEGNSPQHAAANGNGVLSKNAITKPDAPRPLPPTPGSKFSTSPVFKGQAPSPPQNSSGVQHQQQSEQQRRLRSLTASGADITEPTKSIRSIKDQLMSGGGSLGGLASPAPPPAPPPPSLPSSQPKNVARSSAVPNNVPRPPPPSKPQHLISSGDQQAPPPPPSKPPSQKPPLDEVKNRRPDFRTIRPQRPGSSGAKSVISPAHRSNSEENIHQSSTNQISPLTPNSRPAPPPPPQRPPPLPPALNRPSGAPPPPPLPKNSPIGQPKRPQMSNGSPSSASSESAPPPPPPRSDSLISEFEKRFRFRTLVLLPPPEEYSNNSKSYGNFRNGRRPAPKIP